MAELFEVVFQSFWHWAGTLILLAIFMQGIASVVQAVNANLALRKIKGRLDTEAIVKALKTENEEA